MRDPFPVDPLGLGPVAQPVITTNEQICRNAASYDNTKWNTTAYNCRAKVSLEWGW
jgi:hypothetical protein